VRTDGAIPVLRRRETVLAGLFFLLATILATWPQAARIASGLGDVYDAKLNAWIFHWDFHQTFRDPLHLFDANIFHPARYALAFSENLYGAAVFGFPLFTFGASTLFVYNFLFLLGMFLSAMAAWSLARFVTRDPSASLVAGLVFAFVPWRLAQIPHIQFQWGAFLPLMLLFLLRWLDFERSRDLILFAVCFSWNALTNVHYAIFSGLLLVVVMAWEALTSESSRIRRRIGRVVLATAAAAIVVIPFYVPYARAAKLYGMRRSIGEMRFYSARPSALLVAGPQNKLWAPLTQRFARPEAEMFPGVVPSALAVYALFALRNRERSAPGARRSASPARRRVTRVLDVLAGIAFAAGIAGLLVKGLRIGPLDLSDPGRALVFLTAIVVTRLLISFPKRAGWSDLREYVRGRRLDRRAGLFAAIGLTGLVVAVGGYTPYYTFLFQSFGIIFRAIRVPARGMVLFHLALGVLAAWGISILRRRFDRAGEKSAIAAAAIVLTAIEYRAAPIDFPPVQRDPAPVYQWLGTVSIPGAVLEWPIGFDWDAEHVFRSTAHWQKLINGYSGFAPPHYDELKTLLEKRPIPPEAWTRIRELGGAVLVLHPHEVEGLARIHYVRAARKALSDGGLEMLGSFSHDDARPTSSSAARDFVFSIRPTPPFSTGISRDARARAMEEFTRLTSGVESRIAPPFGVIDLPAEGSTVAAGSFGLGWALDDSGIAAVEVATELGSGVSGTLGGARPDIPAAFPDYPDGANSGFGFLVPNLPPGPHTLSITLVANDGGRTVLERRVVVR
jgi:hypothetical protein